MERHPIDATWDGGGVALFFLFLRRRGRDYCKGGWWFRWWQRWRWRRWEHCGVLDLEFHSSLLENRQRRKQTMRSMKMPWEDERRPLAWEIEARSSKVIISYDPVSFTLPFAASNYGLDWKDGWWLNIIYYVIYAVNALVYDIVAEWSKAPDLGSGLCWRRFKSCRCHMWWLFT